MTEIIIIDGVDVKECKRRIGKNNYCRYFKRPCAENNYNCIWKKYLRKEQEVEDLKEYNDRLTAKTNELQAEIGKFRKVYSRVRTEAQGLRVSALSSLRNTERFETPKDKSLHTTRLARILHIATGIEKLLEEIEQ